jgi:predicted RecB family endonuclease
MPLSTTEKGDKYEDVARKVLMELAEHLGLKAVEGKNTLKGLSGTSWEADLGAYDDEDGTVKVECKYRKSPRDNVKQAEMGAFVLSIIDTKASSGIMVTTHSVQAGAEKVAEKYGVRVVQLKDGSTLEEYTAIIKNCIFKGITETVSVLVECEIIVTRADTGEVERHRAE